MKSADEISNAIATSNKTRPCHKWSYDTSVYPRTIITDVSMAEIHRALLTQFSRLLEFFLVLVPD